jgi:hypothetical protein
MGPSVVLAAVVHSDRESCGAATHESLPSSMLVSENESLYWSIG